MNVTEPETRPSSTLGRKKWRNSATLGLIPMNASQQCWNIARVSRALGWMWEMWRPYVARTAWKKRDIGGTSPATTKHTKIRASPGARSLKLAGRHSVTPCSFQAEAAESASLFMSGALRPGGKKANVGLQSFCSFSLAEGSRPLPLAFLGAMAEELDAKRKVRARQEAFFCGGIARTMKQWKGEKYYGAGINTLARRGN